MRRVAVVLVVGLALAGCSSGGKSPNSKGATDTDTPANVTASARPNVPSKLPAGVIAAVGVEGPTEIDVFDPQSGSPVKKVALPAGATPFNRSSFSADWSMLAWTDKDGGLHLAELKGDAYAVIGNWKPTKTDQRYSGPVFQARTGRVFVNSLDGETYTGVVSVDPRNEKETPRAEQAKAPVAFDSAGLAAAPVPVKVDGDQVALVDLWVTDAELVYADIHPRDEGSTLSYQCTQRRDATTMLCVGGGQYGPLATLTYDKAAKSVKLAAVLPDAQDEQVYSALYSPDGKRLLLQSAGGWAVMDAAAGSPPAYQQPKIASGAVAEPYAWI